jgi:hypothetical protein
MLEAGSWFCIYLAGIWPQLSLSWFLSTADFMKKCYKFCTLDVIFEDNAAINSITVQHKKLHSCQI